MSLKINFPLCPSLGSSWKQSFRWGMNMRIVWEVTSVCQCGTAWEQASAGICCQACCFCEHWSSTPAACPRAWENDLGAVYLRDQERVVIHWRLFPHPSRAALWGVSSFSHTPRACLCEGHTRVPEWCRENSEVRVQSPVRKAPLVVAGVAGGHTPHCRSHGGT